MKEQPITNGEKQMKIKKITFISTILILFSSFLAASPNGDKFINDSPSFTIITPAGWKGGVDDANKSKGEFFIKYTGEWRMPSLSVVKVPYYKNKDDLKILIQGAIASFKTNYKGKNFEVLYSKEIKMSDGTAAFEAEIKWRHPMKITLYSTHVWVKKGQTGLAGVLTNMKPNEDSLKAYLYTITLK